MDAIIEPVKKGNGYNWNEGMSNNAIAAYEDGEMPASYLAKELGCKTKDIKENFSYSSWHHTSKYYNKTYFYSIEDMFYENPSKIASITKKKEVLKPFILESLFTKFGFIEKQNKKIKKELQNHKSFNERFEELCNKIGCSPIKIRTDLMKIGIYIDYKGEKIDLTERNLKKKIREISDFKREHGLSNLKRNPYHQLYLFMNGLIKSKGIKQVISNFKNNERLNHKTAKYNMKAKDWRIAGNILKKIHPNKITIEDSGDFVRVDYS